MPEGSTGILVVSHQKNIPLARPVDAVRLCDSLEVLPVTCGCAAQHLCHGECMHIVYWCKCVYRMYVCFQSLPATTYRSLSAVGEAEGPDAGTDSTTSTLAAHASS